MQKLTILIAHFKYFYLEFPKAKYLVHFFSIFINDLYLWITKTDQLTFADDKTITAAERTIENLLSTLETQSQAAIEWFKLNEMIVNPEKFQAR